MITVGAKSQCLLAPRYMTTVRCDNMTLCTSLVLDSKFIPKRENLPLRTGKLPQRQSINVSINSDPYNATVCGSFYTQHRSLQHYCSTTHQTYPMEKRTAPNVDKKAQTKVTTAFFQRIIHQLKHTNECYVPFMPSQYCDILCAQLYQYSITILNITIFKKS